MKKKLLNILKDLTEQTKNSQDIPVAAIIIDDDGNVLSQACNTRVKNNSLIEHAEINALTSAVDKVKSFHLEKYKIVTTLEPCLMCLGAIEQAYISEVIYIVDNHKLGPLTCQMLDKSTSRLKITKWNDIEVEEYFISELKNFFKNLRDQGDDKYGRN
ncbi:tRNA-specific adenosine deaminase [Spiroplasma sabaudiense Ar-1343]|uniref:tRNA-specific adenosine deaminase n=1 Tax=Spiroplasma sabaudiense Ar-1343 TaxID=1276257 RepID=W6A8C7_9MOLU|nr:nucleoside deaminase [Spiroplasma sabaudiense]AHI53418.1 tRNA-specific adenosine deaminase [Spiroplasma sabaudiense Ar-1343]